VILSSQTKSPAERAEFFGYLLPGIIQLALALPTECTRPPILLKSKASQSVTLTQSQIASLLANGFLCTFPPLSSSTTHSYSDINCSKLFMGHQSKPVTSNVEKIRCLLNYFRTVISRDVGGDGAVTFTRKVGAPFNWGVSDKTLTEVQVITDGKIEEAGTDTLQVNFANSQVCGEVLGRGCVQEDIRCVACPELIVAKMFTEHLGDNETLVVTGCERFNRYTGYAQTFQFVGDFTDNTPRDEYRRRRVQVAMMDAMRYKRTEAQYDPRALDRELNKAHCAFSEPNTNGSGKRPYPVATGNWGCGVFKGDPHLKFLIQVMAATEAGREVKYYTYGDGKLSRELRSMAGMLRTNKVPISKLYQALCEYFHKHVKNIQGNIQKDLFTFVYEKLGNSSLGNS